MQPMQPMHGRGVAGSLKSVDGVLQLQRTAGNTAVTRALALQRAPGKTATKTKTPKAPKAPKPRSVAELRGIAKYTKRDYDAAWSAFNAFQPVGYLNHAESRIKSYLDTYGSAYAQVESVLAVAKEEAARRKAFSDAIQGILIGAALGVLTGGLGSGFAGIAEVFEGVASETLSSTVSSGVGKLQGEAPALDPPSQFSATVVALQGWQQLAAVWKSVALLLPVQQKLANLVMLAQGADDGLLALASGGKAHGDIPKYDADLRRLNSIDLGEFRERLGKAQASVGRFAMASDNAILSRDARKVEQDIWMRWIVSLAKPRYDLQRGHWYEWTEEASDQIDEDKVEQHLEKIGLIGSGSRLGVNFGADTDKDDTKKAAEASSKELALLQKVGRLGIVTYGPTGGIHAIQFDTRAYGDLPIPSGGAQGISAAKATTFMSEGDIAQVVDTKDGVLLIAPVAGRKPIAVASHEQQWGHDAVISRR